MIFSKKTSRISRRQRKVAVKKAKIGFANLSAGRGGMRAFAEGEAERPPLTNWSGIPESNRHFQLGKLTYCHYTNPAQAFLK